MSIVEQIVASGFGKKQHAAMAFPTWVLARIEELLPNSISASAESGCGKSTILFSNISKHHTVFCLDDSAEPESSVNYFKECSVTKLQNINIVFGPSQTTLPTWKSDHMLDVALIDGPHGFPFPELEYYYFYPKIKVGGILIVDDVHIPTIGRMADVIAEDEMFELVELVAYTAIFRRTNAPTFNPLGDGWVEQNFNRQHLGNNPFQDNSNLKLPNARKHKPFAQRVNGGNLQIAKQNITHELRRRAKKFFGVS